MTLRAAIYARYSSDRQKATSLDDQIAMARKVCDERGWTVVAEHSDAEMTGKNARRPGFQALRQAIKQGGIDVVVIESVDRMTRRVVASSSAGKESISVRIMAQASSIRSMALSGRKRSEI